MGGYGSGRQGGKRSTDSMNPLDIRRMHRDGLLTPGRAFSWQWTVGGKEVASIRLRTEGDHVILDYRNRSHGGEWRPMEYPVYLEWTNCTLGGRRVWFRCPAEGCGRRVAVLFGGSIFACRHCHGLAYESTRENSGDRAMRRADAIRKRMKWVPGTANPKGDKPKGMHWRTFWRLSAEYDAFANTSWAETARCLGMIPR
ncbi:MAG: hypothetical protein IPL05_06980 [Betaproteobacteria bacterium]|nr:hypothetical protein [Betaproteobacteria bacterium]